MNKIVYLLLFFFPFCSHAQRYYHTTFWSRLAVEKAINKKKNLEIRGKYDLRRQNDFRYSKANIWKQPQLFWFITSIAYQGNHFRHQLILPNYIKSYSLLGKEADFGREPNTEWRITYFNEYSKKLKQWITLLRLGYEYRRITNNDELRITGRARARLAEFYKISPKSSAQLSYELLYNIGPNAAVNTFNQSQMSLRWNQKIGEKLTFTTGINHLLRKRPTLIEFDLENALLCNFVWTL